MDWHFRKRISAWIVLLAAAVLVRMTAAAQPVQLQRALLDHYCVSCHNQRLRTANLALDSLSVDDVTANAAVWEKVLRKLRTAAMPPPGMPRPEPGAVDAFSS